MVTFYRVKDLECGLPVDPSEEEEIPLCLCKKGDRKMYDLWAVSRRDETSRFLLAENILAEQVVKEISKARTVWLPEDYYLVRKLTGGKDENANGV